jgi:hypothetical protein
MIYCAQQIDNPNGVIKIGFSTNPHLRVQQLYGPPGPFQLIGIFEGTKDTETEIHRRLREFRCRSEGQKEWYHFSSAVIEVVRMVAGPPVDQAGASRQAPSRAGKRGITFRLSIDEWKQLQWLSIDSGAPLQGLMEEAVELPLAKHQLKPAAKVK